LNSDNKAPRTGRSIAAYKKTEAFMFRVPSISGPATRTAAAAVAVTISFGAGLAQAADLAEDYGRYEAPYAGGYEPPPRYIPRREPEPYVVRPLRRGADLECRVIERRRVNPYGEAVVERRRVCDDVAVRREPEWRSPRPRYRGEDYAARGGEPRGYEPHRFDPRADAVVRPPRSVQPHYEGRRDFDDED
jgi:hypothetical protein